ncbi:MAG: T9SS type A sorting domain-containing protein [Saprospiraceae bacterium]|nr:T9SS type A sorting domain-containing protein [Saprospiraceae bacterium]
MKRFYTFNSLLQAKVSTFPKSLIILLAFFFSAAIASAAPALTVTARATGSGSKFYYYINVRNTAALGAANVANNLIVTATLPSGATFVSANLGGTISGSTITWNMNQLAAQSYVTPTFICTVASGSITLTNVTTDCDELALATTNPNVSRTYSVPGPVIEVATNGDDATAVSNYIAGTGTHPNFPYKTWSAAYAKALSNNVINQTIKFRPGTYTQGNNTIKSSTTIAAGSGKKWRGLTIDGQGAYFNGSADGVTNYFFEVNENSSTGDASASDITIKNIIFERYRSTTSPNSCMHFYDVDGLVIDNCIFYSMEQYQPLFIDCENDKSFSVTVSNCIFSGNSYNAEGLTAGAMEIGINSSMSASTIVNVNLDGNRWTCNRRDADGGALRIGDASGEALHLAVNITNNIFEGNSSNQGGGGNGGAAIYAGCGINSSMGSLNIYNTQFTDNIFTNCNGSGTGGGAVAIYKFHLNIQGGSFTGNGAANSVSSCASYNAGAINATSNGSVSIYGTTFTGNSIPKVTGFGGVRISGPVALELDNCNFSANSGGLSCNSNTFTNSPISGGAVPTPQTTRTDCVVYSNTLSITGNVFDDANGLLDNLVNGTGTTAGTTLYVAVVDNATGKVVGFATVASNGTYTITNVASGLASATSPTYYLALTKDLPVVGSAPVVSIPAGWENTGENFGAPTVVGNDGSVNSNLTNYSNNLIVNGTATVTNLNFALNKVPLAEDKSTNFSSTPDGVTSYPVPTLTGTDLEDGAYTGVSNTNDIKIQTLPANATLYYNGSSVTAGQTILNYDPTKMTIVPQNGVTSTSFTYSQIDAANAVSAPATVTFAGLLPVTLVSFSANTKDCNTIEFKWVTASEINAKSFVVSYSIDGKNFNTITEVAAVGNSNSYTNYSAKMSDFNHDFAYFKLSQFDTERTTIASEKIITYNRPDICGGNGIRLVNIYPNPTQSSAKVTFEAKANDDLEIKVLDIMGNIILSTSAKAINGIQTVDLATESLPSGIYTVRIFSKETKLNSNNIKLIKN